MKRFLRPFLPFLLLMALVPASWGYVYLDEDFEGTTAFVDRNWPVRDMDTAVTTESAACKGVDLRTILDNAEHVAPKPNIACSGTVLSARHFLGRRSLRIGADQSLKVLPERYVGWNVGEFRLFQFAVSFTTETAQLQPPGKRVGFFRSDWSVNTSNTASASFYLNFVPNKAHRIDIVCSNTATTVTTVDAGHGKWSLVSVLANVHRNSLTEDNPMTWTAYDPLKDIYKGPRTSSEPATFPMISNGISIYVNSASRATFVPADRIGPGWGNDGEDNAILNTNEISWEIGATNSGVFFVDNVYWDCGYHNSPTDGHCLEQAARMLPFDQKTDESTSRTQTQVDQWFRY